MRRLIILALCMMMLSLALLTACTMAAPPAQTPTTTTATEDVDDTVYIYYELNGGVNNPNNPEIFFGEWKLRNPTREGYTFEGWYDNPEFEGSKIGTLYALKKSITLYAKWSATKYTITYDLQKDGAVNNTANLTVYTGDTATDLVLLEPACAGFIFEGWYTDASCSPASKVTAIDPTWMADMTLYANWLPGAGGVVAPTVVPDHPETIMNSNDLLLVDTATSSIGLTASVGTGKPTTIQFVPTESGDRTVLYGAPFGTSEQLRWRNNFATKDFTGYSHLEFWCYSPAATGAQICVNMISSGDKAWNVYIVKLDWSGWKLVSLPIEDPSFGYANFNPAAIGEISFMANGWGSNIAEFNNLYLCIGDLYLMNHDSIYQIDESTITNADLDQVKNNWRDILIGNATLNNASAAAKQKVSSMASQGKNFASSMNMAADRTYLWSNLTSLTTETTIASTYDRIAAMAKAWGAVGSDVYHDPALLEKIISALEFMNTYDADGDGVPGVYGENVNVSTPGNWWHWKIGMPMPLVETLLIIESEIDMDFINRMVKPINDLCPTTQMTVANRTWITYGVLGAALLQQDAAQVERTIQDNLVVFDYVTSDDGFYKDGSMIQHKKLAYIAGYGSSYFSTVNVEVAIFAGTAFDIDVQGEKFSTKYSDMILKQFFDSFEPFCYRGINMWTVSGRGMSVGNIKGQFSNLLLVVGSASKEMQDRFYASMKHYQTVSADYQDLSGSMNLVTLPLYYAYQADTSIKARDEFNFTKIYAGMDRVLTYQEGYSAILAMSSSRIYRYEAINNQGGTGWYLGDGALLIQGSDQTQYNSNYYQLLDRYMIPGTTVSSSKRADMGYSVDTGLLNHSAFVGGVSTGKYGVSAMILSYSIDDNMGSFKSDLTAQKAYFFFDDEIVCLGAGIKATDNDTFNTGNIYTVVANTYITNPYINANGKNYTLSPDNAAAGSTYKVPTVWEDIDYIHLGVNGYVFPGDYTVNARKHGSNFTQVYFDHGSNPNYVGYAYIILPEADANKTAEYAANSDVEILSSSNIVSVVRENTLGITGYVFWYASYCEGIRTSESCILTKTENQDGTLTLNVADPTMLLASVTLTIDGEYNVEGAAASQIKDGKTIITISTAGLFGAGVEVTLTAK